VTARCCIAAAPIDSPSASGNLNALPSYLLRRRVARDRLELSVNTGAGVCGTGGSDAIPIEDLFKKARFAQI